MSGAERHDSSVDPNGDRGSGPVDDQLNRAAEYVRVIGTSNLSSPVALGAGWLAIGSAIGGAVFSIAFFVLGRTVFPGAGFLAWVFVMLLVIATILADVAIVAGTFGRRRASRDPGRRGHSPATIGLALGLGALLIAGVGLPFGIKAVVEAERHQPGEEREYGRRAERRQRRLQKQFEAESFQQCVEFLEGRAPDPEKECRALRP